MGDLDKLIVAKGFKKLPKVQKIAQSGHTALEHGTLFYRLAVQWSLVWFAAWLNKQKSAKYIIESELVNLE